MHVSLYKVTIVAGAAADDTVLVDAREVAGVTRICDRAKVCCMLRAMKLCRCGMSDAGRCQRDGTARSKMADNDCCEL